jgi:hypothetical protein
VIAAAHQVVLDLGGFSEQAEQLLAVFDDE